MKKILRKNYIKKDTCSRKYIICYKTCETCKGCDPTKDDHQCNVCMPGYYKRVGGNGYDDLYDKINKSLVKKYEKLNGLCTATYPNQYYFPDNIAAISSISIYSKLNNDKYKDFLNRWISLYKEVQNLCIR